MKKLKVIWWTAVAAAIPVAALFTIAAGILRPQPMPVLWDDGHGFTVRLTTNGWVTQRGTSAPVTNAFGGGGAPYLSYVASLTQSSTDDPVANVLQNDLGAPIVWSRISGGDYVGDFTNGFGTNVIVFVASQQTGAYYAASYFLSETEVTYLTYTFGGSLNDGDAVFLEIRVYP
jgi:hypothetical protein